MTLLKGIEDPQVGNLSETISRAQCAMRKAIYAAITPRTG